jgi:hypothetical protein
MTVEAPTRHPLLDILYEAAAGRFPPQDEAAEILPSPPGPSDAVCAFTAHHVIATSLDPDVVRAHLPEDPFTGPLSPAFLHRLGEDLGSSPGSLDLVMAVSGARPATSFSLRRVLDGDHPRLARAARHRTRVTAYEPPEGGGIVILGRGLAGRLELSVEVDAPERDAGLGRTLIRAGLGEAPFGEPVYAQVAPGNAASVRAFLAAGFTPIGSEVLFLRP